MIKKYGLEWYDKIFDQIKIFDGSDADARLVATYANIISTKNVRNLNQIVINVGQLAIFLWRSNPIFFVFFC